VTTQTKRTCLLVLGIHRSGTSALTRVLSLMGAALPKNIMPPQPDNETGFWEPKRFADLNDQILRELGSGWSDWCSFERDILHHVRIDHYKSEIQRLLTEEYGSADLIVLKDPRLCRFVPLYAEALREAGFRLIPVISLRNPMEVADSLARRDGMPLSKASLLWLRHVLEAEAATRGMKRLVVSFDHLVDNVQDSAERIQAQVGLPWQPVPEDVARQIVSFVTPSQRHHRRSTEEVRQSPLTRHWVAETYEHLLQLANDRSSAVAFTALDRIKAEFDACAPVIQQHSQDARAPLLVEKEVLSAAVSAANAKANDLADTLSKRIAAHAEDTTRAEALSAKLVEVGAHAARIADELAQRDAAASSLALELASLQDQLRETDRQLQQANLNYRMTLDSRSWAITQPLRSLSHQRNRAKVLLGLLPQMRVAKGGYLPLFMKFLSVARIHGLSGVKIRLARFSNAVALHAHSAPEISSRAHERQISKYDLDWQRIVQRQKQGNPSRLLDSGIQVVRGVIPQLYDSISGNALPVISLLTPVYNTENVALQELIECVKNQSYPNWELILVDDASPEPRIKIDLLRYAGSDARIKIILRPKNGGISAATNDALAAATGSYIGMLDHDDILTKDALFEVARVINAWPEVDFIYSDEDKTDGTGRFFEPYFKPDWSPSLLLARMYTSHFSVYRRSIVKEAGGFRSEFDGTQDYDLALRISELTDKVYHIPRILYHWRASATSTAGNLDAKGYAVGRQRKALESALARRTIQGDIHPTIHAGNWRPVFDLPTPAPLISIVIPTAGQRVSVRNKIVSLLINCVSTIIEKSTYPRIEIVTIHNGDLDAETLAYAQSTPQIKLVHYASSTFNLAAKINLGVEQSSGEYVVLLNDDIEVITPDWLESMLRIAQHEDVGAVGAKLFFEHGPVQHVGVVAMDAGLSHAMIGSGATDPGPDLICHLLRDTLGVTGACLMCRRDRYLEVGGFDLAFPLNYNDVDFCLRLRDRGWRNVIEPSAQLYHFESVSKSGTYLTELNCFNERWGQIDDPFYNMNFDRSNPFFRPLPYFHDTPSAYGSWLSKCLAARSPAINGSSVSDFLYSFVTSAYNTDPIYLYELADCVRAQVACKYEWVLLDNGSTRPECREALEKIAIGNSKVRLLRVEDNLGIIGGMAYGLQHAKGEFFLPLDSDDLLTCDALAVMDTYIRRSPAADLFYSDEDKCNGASDRFSPFLKPDWDPVMFFGCCYVAHLCAIRTKKAMELGAYTDPNANGCHDWDTFYRFIRNGGTPVHVPEVVYSWRIHAGSTASADPTVKPFTITSQEFVLNKQIEWQDPSGQIEICENPLYGHTGMWRLQRKKVYAPKTLLLQVGGGNSADMKTDAIPGLVIECVDDELQLERTLLAAASKFDMIAVLTDRVQPINDDWLWEGIGLLEFFKDAVVASGRIVDENGVTLWSGGDFGYHGGGKSTYEGLLPGDSGYHGSAFLQRTVHTFSPHQWVAKSQFITQALSGKQKLSLAQTAGVLAIEAHGHQARIIASPFMMARAASGLTVAPHLSSVPAIAENNRWYPRKMSATNAWTLDH